MDRRFSGWLLRRCVVFAFLSNWIGVANGAHVLFLDHPAGDLVYAYVGTSEVVVHKRYHMGYQPIALGGRKGVRYILSLAYNDFGGQVVPVLCPAVAVDSSRPQIYHRGIDSMAAIRVFQPDDMEQVLTLWLEASIKAHDFIDRAFWESKVTDMRHRYLPAAETYVYDEAGSIEGFLSLSRDTLAAIFVAPGFQGQGIGKQLMGKAKDMRQRLMLTVYKENHQAIAFYHACGFRIEEEQADEHSGHPELVMVFES